MKVHLLDPSSEIAYVGPDLSAGPLPALFYFSISAHDSLSLDPFNQPVAYLSRLPMRIFSISLPGHENQLPPREALSRWAEEISRGRNVIGEFVDKVKSTVQSLIAQNILIPEQIGVAGLSRGAFIAAHAAAIIPEFQWILGFAPLTDLSGHKEFQHMQHIPLVHALGLETTVPHLYNRSLRFYIGNLDTLVSTRRCFDFIEKLTQTAQAKGIRSPNVELIIAPSIGREGHGTSKEVFHAGAQWIAEKLRAIDVV